LLGFDPDFYFILFYFILWTPGVRFIITHQRLYGDFIGDETVVALKYIKKYTINVRREANSGLPGTNSGLPGNLGAGGVAPGPSGCVLIT